MCYGIFFSSIFKPLNIVYIRCAFVAHFTNCFNGIAINIAVLELE